MKWWKKDRICGVVSKVFFCRRRNSSFRVFGCFFFFPFTLWLFLFLSQVKKRPNQNDTASYTGVHRTVNHNSCLCGWLVHLTHPHNQSDDWWCMMNMTTLINCCFPDQAYLHTPSRPDEMLNLDNSFLFLFATGIYFISAFVCKIHYPYQPRLLWLSHHPSLSTIALM